MKVNASVRSCALAHKPPLRENYLLKNWYSGITKHFVVVVALMGLASCNPNNTVDTVEDEKPDVVATSTLITDWTEIIAQDTVDLTGILEPGADPHVYEPVPADSQAFEDAELILYNGYNLEPGLIKIMNAAGINAQKFAVGEVVSPLDFEYQGQTEPDPHVWGDVENVMAMVSRLSDQLITLTPENEAVITQNTETYLDQLQQLDTWITQQIATIPPENRQLVTTHDAFQYYANAYGLEIPGTLIGISTEEQPSAQTVQQLIETIKASNIPAIFAETTINPTLISTVAEEANVELAEPELYADSVGAPGSPGDSYIKMMVSNTRTIVEALGGEVE
jgi:manganese/iron transport system substrate-binding protein